MIDCTIVQSRLPLHALFLRKVAGFPALENQNFQNLKIYISTNSSIATGRKDFKLLVVLFYILRIRSFQSKSILLVLCRVSA